MTVSVRLFSLAVVTMSASLGFAIWSFREVRADSPSWIAAYIHPVASGIKNEPLLTLFPAAGPQIPVSLPRELQSSLTLNAFGPDGKSIYVQNSGRSADGIIRIDFKPTRGTIIPGSVGLATIWHLTASRPPGRIFVSGGISTNPPGCGTFEINPDAGTLRRLLLGAYPDCGGGGGVVSPDGKRAAIYTGKEFQVRNLETGSVRVIEGIGAGANQDFAGLNRVDWSPDGRWISAISGDNRIVLIDATDWARRKNLGSSGGAPIHWCPDSKYLLVLKSQLRCTATLYFDSLEKVDVETGKRSVINSSRCAVGPGWVGWMDREAVQ